MKFNKTRYKIVNIICVSLLLGVVIYLAFSWNRIPEKIPGHYSAAGDIDRWGSREELLILPIISWIMYIGITVIEKCPQIWNTGVTVTDQNKEQVYRILKNLLETVKLLMVAVFSFVTINSSLAIGLPLWFLPLFLVLMFGAITFFIMKLIKVK